MDWLKARFSEPSTYIALGVLAFIASRVTGADTATMVDWITNAVTDIGVLAGAIGAAVGALMADKE